MRYGNKHEPDASRELEERTSLKIFPAKKYIPRKHKWLVCKPDGVAKQLCRNGRYRARGIVEVKCPHSCRNKSFQEVMQTHRYFCLEYNKNGKLQLKKDHYYYYQVQGMLNMMEYSRCYFAVWSRTEFHWEIIYRDRRLWNLNMFPKLYNFYR